MRAAAAAFLGEHDFTAFSNAKGKKKSMVRKIDAFTLQQDGPLLTLRVRGNGFLYNMVRKMVGALLQVGLGQLTAQGIAQLLANELAPVTVDRKSVIATKPGVQLFPPA